MKTKIIMALALLTIIGVKVLADGVPLPPPPECFSKNPPKMCKK